MHISQHARQFLGFAVHRQRVRRGTRQQIAIVACPFAKYVRLAEPCRIVARHGVDRDELFEGAEGRRRPNRSLVCAVRELFELHREFDVGERASAELEMELWILAGRDALALDARLHPADLTTPPFRERFAVHVLVRGLHEARTKVGVAGDGPGSRQRLELPHLRPLAPVGVVALDRSGEHAVPAVGPEPRVDTERLTLGRVLADRAHEPGRDLLGDREVVDAGSLEHEHHVDVGCVGQLASAQASEADHCERDLGFQRLQRCLDARVGEIRQPPAGCRKVREAQ